MKPRPASAGPAVARFAVVVFVAFLWLAVASAAQAAVPKSFFGVVPQAPLSQQDVDRMGQGEVGTVRFEISWSGVDPTAADDYNWDAPDAVIGNAARNGIQGLPFIFSTPKWVAELDGRNCEDPDTCLSFAPRKPQALEAWEGFLTDLAERYGPSGEFWALNPLIPKKPIRVWQIWNEQNSPTFFKPKPDVPAYAKLLSSANDALTAVDRKAEIVLGGMFGTPLGGAKPAVSAWKYLGRLYDVKGAKQDFDGVAPHPYGSKLDNVTIQLDLLRDEMVAANDGDADFWITEIGWASGGPPNPLNRGIQGQADRLKEIFRYFKRKRGKLNIRNVDWYSWRDNLNSGAGLCEWCPRSGLFDEDLTPKPSWDAFTAFTGGS